MSAEFQYDVFLSHSSLDKAVVRGVAARLKMDGVRLWLDEEQIKPGDNIPAQIELGLERSRVLVLCMSANAFGSDWTQLEAGTFRFRDPLNKARRFVPLRLDDTPVKGSLAQFLYIRWHAADREREYPKLLEACRPPASPSFHAGPPTEQVFSTATKTNQEQSSPTDDDLRSGRDTKREPAKNLPEGASDKSKPTAHTAQQREHTELLAGIQSFLDNFDKIGEGNEERHVFKLRLVSPPDPNRPEHAQIATPAGSFDEALLDAYEQRGRRVLFIGQPGAGKTFAMLKLMELLVRRARREQKGPIPVYFNLASWVFTRPRARDGRSLFNSVSRAFSPARLKQSNTLDGWLEDELVTRYGMARKAARRIIGDRQVILCLDGLDELTPISEDEKAPQVFATQQLRSECITVLNRTLETDQAISLILCCRESTYDELPCKPRLGLPLQVEPLSIEDCKSYLADWADLDGLRAAIEKSALLSEKAKSPLFLKFMAVSYREMTREGILAAVAKGEAAWEEHLLDNYVQQCISIPQRSIPVTRCYTKADIPIFLGWLARQPENDFLVENMQPSLLAISTVRGPKHPARWYQIISACAPALFLAATIAVPSGVAIGIDTAAHDGIAAGVRRGLLVGVINGVITVGFGLPAFSTRNPWLFGVLLGVAFGTARAFTVGLSPLGLNAGTPSDGLRAAAISIPCAMVILLVMAHQTLGKIEQLRRRYKDRPGIDQYEIQPLENFQWQFIDPTSRWRSGGWLGLLIGPIIGLLMWKYFDVARGISFGLIVTLFVSVFSGLSGTGLRVSLGPNQGIVRSARNAIFMMLMFGLAGALAFGVAYGSAYNVHEGLVNSMLGLVLTFSFLFFGGIPVLRHVSLGWVLHLQGNLPSWLCWPPWANTLSFFQDMVRFKLLRRTAGGFMFRHEKLRQYYRRVGS